MKLLLSSPGFGLQVTLGNINSSSGTYSKIGWLNTRNLLRRKNEALDDYSGAICSLGIEETSFHLFFQCPFSSSCWNYLAIQCNLNLPPLDMVIQRRFWQQHI
jgi:hypothetical protein